MNMFRKRGNQNRRHRRGVASLEFVMGFPILAMLIAMLYTVYFATITKSQVTMEVRHKAWLARSNPLDAQPFSLADADTAGETREELTRIVEPYRSWYPNVQREVTWGNVLLVGSWDHRAVPFDKKGWIPVYPHLDVLQQMIAGGVGASSSSTNQVRHLTTVPMR